MSGTLLLRVDVEHVEAARWAGDGAIEPPATRRLLALLAELGATASFAFVGATAAAYPELARAARDAGHAILGHSMHHAAPYAGQPIDRQRRDLAEMAAAIEDACGARVEGLAAPCHGDVDAATLRAAAEVGLRYVLNFALTTPGDDFAPIDAGGVLVPPASMKVVWDWTHLQPGWPRFSADEARRDWRAAIDGRGLVELIVHPWIVATNDEWSLLADTLDYARSAGLRLGTVDGCVREAAACA